MLRLPRSASIVLPVLCLLTFLSAEAQTPVALPFTMTTYAGLNPAPATSGSACWTGSAYKTTDVYGDGCPATNAIFGASGRGGVAVDNQGYLFIADDIDSIAHVINPNTGIMTVLAGNGTACSAATATTAGKVDSDGDGCLAATQTVLKSPRGIGIDPYGNILLSGYSDNLVHMVCRNASPLCVNSTPTPTASNPIQIQIGTMGLVAGCAAATSSTGAAAVGLDNTPGFSTAVSPQYYFKNAGACTTSLGDADAPRGMTADRYGNIYYADTNSDRWRVVLAPKTNAAFFGGNNPLWAALGVYYPSLTTGYVYSVADTGGTSTTTSTSVATVKGATCSVTTNSTTYSGTALDAYGDGCPFELSTVTLASGDINTVATDAAGNMIFTDPGHGLRVLFVQGWATAAVATTAGATGAVATAGVAMYNAITVNNPTATPKPGFIYMLAGGGTTAISTTPTLGNSTAALDSAITKVTVSPQGNIYIGDSNRVLFFDINTGYIRILLTSSATGNTAFGSYCSGTSGQKSLSALGDGCPATSEYFADSNALGIAVDGQGNLYTYSQTNSTTSAMEVRKILAQGFGVQPPATMAALSYMAGLSTPTAAPELTLGTPLIQTFEAHLQGATSATSTVTHSANGDIAGYATPTCTLNADSSVDCTEKVTVTPSSVGLRAGNMTLANASSGQSLSFNLGGTIAGSVMAVDNATSGTTPVAPSTNSVFASIAPAAVAVDGAANLYAASGTKLLESINGTTFTLTSSLPATPSQIAVDQSGNIFAVASGTPTITELLVSASGSPSTYTTTNFSYTPTSGTAAPVAVAVDMFGNVYVGDATTESVYVLSQAAGAIQASTPIASGFKTIASLAVDSFGNVYVGDTGNNAVYKLTPGLVSGLYTYAQTTAVSSVTPTGLAADAAGDIYVQSGTTVTEFPVSGPTAAGVTVLTGLGTPVGLAVDGFGDVYSADASNTFITEVVRDTVSFNFGTSETVPYNATLTNVGNAPSTGAPTMTNISLQGGNTSPCSITTTLNAMTAGQACTISAEMVGVFSPTSSGPLPTATDMLNFTPAATSLGSLAFSGTLPLGVQYATTTTISAPVPASPVYVASNGTEATFTVTVAATITPTNTVNVTVDSTTAAYKLNSSGVATVTVSGLLAGTHSISAQYLINGNYTGSSATAQNFTIAQVATSLSWTPAATTQQVSAALGTAVLNATETPSVAGNFVYSITSVPSCTSTAATNVDASTYLAIGSYTLYATFCPNDLTDYGTSSATVTGYTVTKATATAAVGATTNLVAADGTGNYTSLASALASLPPSGGTLYLKPGEYYGQNAISYPNVQLRGLGGNPANVILTASHGAFSAATGFIGTGTYLGNAQAGGDQGSSTLDVSASKYMGTTLGSTSYTPNNFYAEYLTIQNTYNTDNFTTNTFNTISSGGTCTGGQAAQTLSALYNAGTECSSQALALWIMSDAAILNNVNLTSLQDTLYAGSVSCGTSSTTYCTAARQYMWKGQIVGDVDYVFGDAALVFDHTNFFTAWHGTTATGTETIEAQNKYHQTGAANDYLSGYICNACTLLSQSTGMTNLYYGRPYGPYSTWIMLNNKVDQVIPAGWLEFSGDTNLPTSTYAEFTSTAYTDPAVGTAPYPAGLFYEDSTIIPGFTGTAGTTVTPTALNVGTGVTGTRESTSGDPGTIEASNTLKTLLTAPQAAQYYPVNFLATPLSGVNSSYPAGTLATGQSSTWNPVSALAMQVNGFVPVGSIGSVQLGTSVTIVGRPQTPGAGVIPTGAYTFLDGTTVIASGTLDASGEAYLITGPATSNALTAGTHTITMTYAGDSNFTGVTSSPYAIVVLQSGQLSTATALSVNNISSVSGTVVTGTVTVTPSAATGTVSVSVDGLSKTTCSLSGGACNWALNGLSTGTHSVNASFAASGNYGASTSLATAIYVEAAVATGDTRTVTEPSFPAVCQQLSAALTTDPAINDLDASVDATNTNIDGARIQAALNACSGTGQAVELSADSTGAFNAFLSGPLSMPSNVTLLVDPNITLYFSRNAQDYDKVSGTHTCGTINGSSATGSCAAVIDIPGTSTNVGIMGYGKLNGRGGDTLLNGFATSGYAAPSTYSWWNLSTQANGEGNQQNPRFIQMDSGSSNITLYKISILNSPLFHVSTTGAVSGFTAWDIKIVTPTSSRNTDGIDPGNATNFTITRSWISDGDDNVAVGAAGTTVPAANITVTNNHFFAGHGESIGSYTGAGVSNVLWDSNMSAGNGYAGAGSATVTGTADGNSTGIRIKSGYDRGGLVSWIQYSNSCFLDHKSMIDFNPNYENSTGTLAPNFQNILMQNLVFLNDTSAAGTVQFTGTNDSAVTPSIIPLQVTLDNVTFPSALSSSSSYFASPETYAQLTFGPGQVSTNFLNGWLSYAGSNGDTATNNIVVGGLNPPVCTFTYLAPELTGPTGLPQTITFGQTGSAVVILTPAVGGAAYPTGTVTLTDALTSTQYTGAFTGTGDTISIPLPGLSVGTHTFSATSYAGDANYTVPAAYQNFGSYVVTVLSAQTINFAPTVTSYTYAPAGTFSLVATATSGLAVSFASTTSGVCSVSGSTATILAVGTCTIQATQPGNSSYGAATPVSVNFTIGQSTQSITFAPSVTVYTYSPTGTFNLSATASSGLAVSFASTTTAVCTVSGTTATIVSAGTCTIQATQAGNSNYLAAATVPVSYTLGKSPQTITYAPSVTAYTYSTGGTFSLSATSSSGLAVGFASTTTGVCTVSGTTATIVSGGTCTVQATQAGNGNYLAATAVSVNYSIGAAAPTVVVVSSLNPVLLQNAVTFTATVSSKVGSPTGTVTFRDGTTSIGTGTLASGVASLTTSTLALGTHAITVAYSGDTNFATGTSAALTQTVATISIGTPTSNSGGAATETVLPGGTASYLLPILPNTGTTFPSALTLTVTGLPAGATATITPSSWTPATTPSFTWTLAAITALGGNTQLNIQLPQTASAAEPAGRPLYTHTAPFVLALLLLPFAGRLRRAGKRFGRTLSVLLLAAASLAAIAGVSGCGSSSGFFVQAQQSYQVTVTVSSGSLSQSTNVTLIVE